MLIAQRIVSVLLGALFVFAGLFYFFGTMPPPPPADTPAGMFFGAFSAGGYLDFIKILEVVGGLLVMIPRTRVAGLIVLTPVVVNVVAFHVFITGGEGLVGAPLVAAAMNLFLIWSHRRAVGVLLADRG